MVSLHSDAQNLSRCGMQDRVKTQKFGGRFQGTATPLKIATSATCETLQQHGTGCREERIMDIKQAIELGFDHVEVERQPATGGGFVYYAFVMIAGISGSHIDDSDPDKAIEGAVDRCVMNLGTTISRMQKIQEGFANREQKK